MHILIGMSSLGNPAYPLIRTQELFEAFFTPFAFPGPLPLVEREIDAGLLAGGRGELLGTLGGI